MAEGGDDFVEQLTTPVSAMHISPPAPLQSRVKREATSPTGHTPMAKKKRARTQYSSRKRLTFASEVADAAYAPSAGPWTDHETKALLEFLLFHRGPRTSPGTAWCRRNCGLEFWAAASNFVQMRANTQFPRTGAVTKLKSPVHYICMV